VKRAAVVATFICAFGLSVAAEQQQPPPVSTDQPPQRGTPPPPGGTVATGPGRGRPTPPQPQQTQGPEYLAGTWQFTWTGRESPVSTGPRCGTTTFTQKGTTLEISTVGKSDDTGAVFKESGTADWNDAQKTLSFKEKLSGGAEISGVGNWSSPLAIRYESQPARVGKQSVRLRRNYQILSPTSFSIAEEISIDGGPFQRLGNGAFSKK
jgi:hypothetical protein